MASKLFTKSSGIVATFRHSHFLGIQIKCIWFNVCSISFAYVITKMHLQIAIRLTHRAGKHQQQFIGSCLTSFTTTPNIVMKAIKLTDFCDSVSFLIAVKRQRANTAEFSSANALE